MKIENKNMFQYYNTCIFTKRALFVMYTTFKIKYEI